MEEEAGAERHGDEIKLETDVCGGGGTGVEVEEVRVHEVGRR